MICHKTEAIEKMNAWGRKGEAFLFVIDFEMSRIILADSDLLAKAGIRVRIRDFISENVRDDKYLGIKPEIEVFPIKLERYYKAFETVQRHIRHGNSYLLNLTFPTRINLNMDLDQIFAISRARYKLLLPGQFVVFSPETFVMMKDDRISSFPMKGTIDASIPGAKSRLLRDAKEIAEHYTIVDLIRNDLGRVSEKVNVKQFRYVEKIRGNNRELLQTSSEIEGQLPKDWRRQLGDIIFELLPAGSVSGAPKEKTIEIIREAEGNPRGYYTGVFGYFDGKSMESAVMIRFIELVEGQYYFRSGGGITYRSEVEAEYRELLQKIYVPVD